MNAILSSRYSLFNDTLTGPSFGMSADTFASSVAGTSAFTADAEEYAAPAFEISPDDVIFVDVTTLGRPVGGFSVKSCSCLADVIEAVRRRLSNREGLLSLTLRNRSLGTSVRRVVRLSKGSAMLCNSIAGVA